MFAHLGAIHKCNGTIGQLPLARLKFVVPVWVVDKVLRNEVDVNEGSEAKTQAGG